MVHLPTPVRARRQAIPTYGTERELAAQLAVLGDHQRQPETIRLRTEGEKRVFKMDFDERILGLPL